MSCYLTSLSCYTYESHTDMDNVFDVLHKVRRLCQQENVPVVFFICTVIAHTATSAGTLKFSSIFVFNIPINFMYVGNQVIFFYFLCNLYIRKYWLGILAWDPVHPHSRACPALQKPRVQIKKLTFWTTMAEIISVRIYACVLREENCHIKNKIKIMNSNCDV